LNRYNAWAAIRKRAKGGGFSDPSKMSHLAGKMAKHSSPRTTKLYDGRTIFHSTSGEDCDLTFLRGQCISLLGRDSRRSGESLLRLLFLTMNCSFGKI
jgi:hypothetical protein